MKSPQSIFRTLLPCAVLFCLGSSSPVLFAAGAQADPLLEPPALNIHPGPEYQQDVRAGSMIIGMDRTPNGRIWGCWTGTGDNTESYFILATSDDGGATWSKPRLVIDPPEIPGLPPRYLIIGNLWTDPTGKLWLFFDQQMKDGIASDWYITCDNPDADEPVWSKPAYFADGSTLNKPTILKNGDWLLPVSLLTHGRVNPAHPEIAPLDPMAHVYVSTDQGKMWTRRGGVAIPEAQVNHNEPMTVELSDGRLWMLLRTRYGIAESYSSDGGRTWSEAQPSSIQNPSTRFFLRRLQSGRLLLVKNGPIAERLRGRSHLTAFLSEDDGKTWGPGLLLDDRNALSYPDGFQSPDGLIHILYDWNRHTDAEVLFTTFREEDILAGKLVSPDARTRHVVDKARAPGLSQSNIPLRQWASQAAADAKLDRTAVVYDGTTAKQQVTDTMLRAGIDGFWLMFLSADGGKGQPTRLARSPDQGKTWTPFEEFNPSLPAAGQVTNHGLIEFILGKDSSLVATSTYAPNWPAGWRSWLVRGDVALAQWGRLSGLQGRLADRTFVRNHIVTRDGRILLPFQHYAAGDIGLSDPRCGILSSSDGGRTWTEHGDIRLGPVKRAFGWTESNLIELEEGRLIMLIRQPGMMGLLYVAESRDGGRTWPDAARLFRAPTGGTAALFSLGGNAVAMIHNPNNSLALWVSFDGMKTWPYQRALAHAACAGPKDSMSQPHGFISADREWVNFSFVDSQSRAVYFSAKLPPLK